MQSQKQQIQSNSKEFIASELNFQHFQLQCRLQCRYLHLCDKSFENPENTGKYREYDDIETFEIVYG